MYKPIEMNPPSWGAIIAIIVLWLILFMVMGQVPLVSALQGSLNYNSMREANLPFIVTACTVGTECLGTWAFACYLEDGSKRTLSKAAVAISPLLLDYSRSGLIICFAAGLLLYFARAKKNKKVGCRGVVAAIIILAAIWVFGILGNLRSGYAWNDSSCIVALGRYNASFPEFIPKEFCWAYSYITSPLANLNYNVIMDASIVDPVNYAYRFLPMMLAKRLPLYTAAPTLLQVSYFTVSSAWSDFYSFGGSVGLILSFAIQLLVLRLMMLFVKTSPVQTLAYSWMGVVVLFMFFMNSFTYPSTMYPLIVFAVAAYALKHGRRVRKVRSIIDVRG